MKNNTLTPQIRFKGFEEEWKETMIGNLLSIGNGCDYKHLESGDIPVFGTGGLMTTVNQYLYDGESVFIGRKGTIDKPFYYNGKFWTVDTLFYTHSFKGSIPSYIFPLFQTINWYLYNAATGVPSLSKECILDIKVKIAPSLAEQSAIGEYFRRVDELIAEAEREVSRLEKMKQASLQKMFPRPGESVPEVRFAGFTEDWKTVRLGDLFLYLKNNTLSRDCLNYESGIAKNMHYGDILIKYGSCIDVNDSIVPFVNHNIELDFTTLNLLANGDIIMADTAEDEAVGKCVEIFGADRIKVVSGLHTISLRPISRFAPFYLGYFLNSPYFHIQLLPLMQGVKVLSINRSALEGTKVSFPESLAEQAAIGEYFRNLDSLIDARRRRVAKLRDIKKACLDKMFAASAP